MVAQGVKPALSILVPLLNEADTIEATLRELEPYRARGAEIIFCDGGSADATMTRAAAAGDLVISAPRGRGSQMNAAAAQASGDTLLFLHADTRLPDNADQCLRDALASGGHVWGRFDVLIEGASRLLLLVGAMMNLRSRLTGVATGDQAIFARADAFRAAGGFPDIPLMEDIAFSSRMKRLGPPLCLRARVKTSGRRWERHGVARTILLMWRLRAAYFLGADPRDLAVKYGYRPRQD
jgi:rSAM/selenodomain-associated transferase 2